MVGRAPGFLRRVKNIKLTIDIYSSAKQAISEIWLKFSGATVTVASPLQHNKQLWHIVEKKLLNTERDR
jgi:hypothetical protein